MCWYPKTNYLKCNIIKTPITLGLLFIRYVTSGLNLLGDRLSLTLTFKTWLVWWNNYSIFNNICRMLYGGGTIVMHFNTAHHEISYFSQFYYLVLYCVYIVFYEKCDSLDTTPDTDTWGLPQIWVRNRKWNGRERDRIVFSISVKNNLQTGQT